MARKRTRSAKPAEAAAAEAEPAPSSPSSEPDPEPNSRSGRGRGGGRRAASPPPAPTTSGRRASARQLQRRSAAGEAEDHDSDDGEVAPPLRKKPRLASVGAAGPEEDGPDPDAPSDADADSGALRPTGRRRGPGRPPAAAATAEAKPPATTTTTTTSSTTTARRGRGRPPRQASSIPEPGEAEDAAPPKRSRSQRRNDKDDDRDNESVAPKANGQEEEDACDDSKDSATHKKRTKNEEENSEEGNNESSSRDEVAPPSSPSAGPVTSAMTAQLVSNVLNSYTRQSSSRSLATSPSSNGDTAHETAAEAATASGSEKDDEGAASESEPPSIPNKAHESKATKDAGADASAEHLSLLANASNEQEPADATELHEGDAREEAAMASSPTGGASQSQEDSQMSPLEFLARSAVAAMTAIPAYAPSEAIPEERPKLGNHDTKVVGQTVEQEQRETVANISKNPPTESSGINIQEAVKMDGPANETQEYLAQDLTETGEPDDTLLTANQNKAEENTVIHVPAKEDLGEPPEAEEVASKSAVDTTSGNVTKPCNSAEVEVMMDEHDQFATEATIKEVDEESAKADSPELILSKQDDDNSPADTDSQHRREQADESTGTARTSLGQDSDDVSGHATSLSDSIEEKQRSAAQISAVSGKDQAGQAVPIETSQDADASDMLLEKRQNTIAATTLSSEPNDASDTNETSDLQHNATVPMELEPTESERSIQNDSFTHSGGMDVSGTADSMEIEKLDEMNCKDSKAKEELPSSISDRRASAKVVELPSRDSIILASEHTNSSKDESDNFISLRRKSAKEAGHAVPKETSMRYESENLTCDLTNVAHAVAEQSHAVIVIEEESFRADQKTCPASEQSIVEISRSKDSSALRHESSEVSDMLELMKTGTSIFPPIISDAEVESTPTKTIRVLSLDRLKLRIYNEGRRIHKGRRYENFFANYWSAIAQRLESSVSASTARKCQSIIDQFLNTKRLRKLHNRLVLGLLERCVQPHALIGALNDRIPAAWRDRVRVSTWQSLDKQIDEKHGDSTLNVSEEPHVTDLHLKSSLFGPPFYGRDTSLVVTPDTTSLNVKSRPISASLPVPGALLIDPYVRAISSAHGMKASESAVWLLVIAMKHFISARIGDAIDSSNIIDSLHLSPTSSATILKTTESGKQQSAPETESNRVLKSAVSHCLDAFAFHVLSPALSPASVVATTSVHERGTDSAQLKNSIGGPASRAAFENGLFTLWNDNMGQETKNFEDVKRFLTSKLSVFTPVRERHSSPSNHLPLASVERHTQIATGGLGRGAKDLASLKARTAPKSSPITTSVRASPLTVTTRASPETTSNRVDATTLPSDVRVGPAASSATQDDDDKPSTSTPDGSDAVHHPMRKGKGFGVKNLAAMRARSVTSLTKAEEIASSEATVSLEAPDDSKLRINQIQDESDRQVDETRTIATNAPNRHAADPNNMEVTTSEMANSVGTPDDSKHIVDSTSDELVHQVDERGTLAVNEPSPTVTESPTEIPSVKTEGIQISKSTDVFTTPDDINTEADHLGGESTQEVDEASKQAIDARSSDIARSSSGASLLDTEGASAAEVAAGSQKISEVAASSASPGDSKPIEDGIRTDSSQEAGDAASHEAETVTADDDEKTPEAVGT